MAETEPNVQDGYDYLLTDAEILKLDFTNIPDYKSAAIIDVVDKIKRIEYASKVKSYGREEYLSEGGSSSEMIEAERNAVLWMLKNLTPTKVLEVELRSEFGIQLNTRVRVQSDSRGVDETFILLGKQFTADPVPNFIFELGYNLQDLENYLKV